MEYKISKVGFFSNETYGRDNNHRVMVNFEGQEKDYSAFVQEKPSVGDVWIGELKKVEKNDKIYHNFEFEKKERTSKQDFSPSVPEIKNLLTLKVIPLLEQNNAILRAIAEQKGVDLRGIVKEKYPEITEENDGSPF